MGTRRRDSLISMGVTTLAILLWPFPSLAGPNISISMTTEQAFGTLLAPASGSASLSLDPATNVRTYAGSAIGATATRGVIAISNGNPGTTYTWSLDVPTVALGGNAFTATYYSVNAASTASGLFDASGNDTLYFAATGAVASSTASGAYSDTPTLTITPSAQSARTERLKFQLSAVAPLVVTKTRDLAFGTVTSTGTAGTITVPAVLNPTATATGGASVVNGATSGRFSLTGEKDLTYTLGVTPSTLTLAGPGAATMTASSWVTSPASPATLPNSGSETIYVGGTLAVGASQAQGTYAGILTLTVNYQ